MDITDELFPRQTDTTLPADRIIPDTAPATVPSLPGAVSPNYGFGLEAVQIPLGLSLSSKVGTEQLSELLLPSTAIGRLLHAILETAARLAIAPDGEWTPLQAKRARDEQANDSSPTNKYDWKPSGLFLGLVKPMTLNQLPSPVAEAVSGVFAEAFAGFCHQTPERRFQIAKFLPAPVAVPIFNGNRRLLDIQPDSEGAGFDVTFAQLDGTIDSGSLYCPLPTIQRLADLFAEIVLSVGSESMPNAHAGYCMANLSAGIYPKCFLDDNPSGVGYTTNVRFDPQGPFAGGMFSAQLDELRELIVGLVIFAARSSSFIPEHRKRYLQNGDRAFINPFGIVVRALYKMRN